MSAVHDGRIGPKYPAYVPVADHALLVSFGDVINDDASASVLALDRALTGVPPLGFRECVPAFVNLLVLFDPVATDHHLMKAAVEELVARGGAASTSGRVREVAICYEGALAPDLADVALSKGLAVEQVVNWHLGGDYQVRMYGFAPGYAYMSGIPKAIQVPRKSVVLRDIAAGSVIAAGPQCLVTTLVMPTGWSIIGRSPTKILTGDVSAPFLFDVGDRVQFKRISLSEFEQLDGRGRKGAT